MRVGLPLLAELGSVFALCYLGKWMYAWFQRWPRVDYELTARDNVAFAVPLGSYYLGVLLLLGGPWSTRLDGWSSLLITFVSGLVGVGMLNISMRLMDYFFFTELKLQGRIVQGRSLPAGTLMAGSHIACALVVWGALSDEGGWRVAIVFWLYAQALLIVTGRLFCRISRYRLASELRRGNQAVALAVAGSLVGIGNILRLALSGPFTGWSNAAAACTGYAFAGLGLLLVARQCIDWLLLPGVTIRDEIVRQEIPNIGVGFLLAIFYIGLSVLIGWVL